MSIDSVHLGVLALDRVAFAIVCGTAATWLWLLPSTKEADQTRSALAIPLFGAALLMLATAGIAELLLRTAAMADVRITDVWPYLSKVINRSQFGQLWLLRVVVWLALAMLWLWIWRRGANRPACWAIAVGAALTALVFSAAGHAGDDGILTFRALANALHIAGGCVWGGTVLVYALRILPALRRTDQRTGIAHTATQLSTVAGTALAVVLVTGLYNAWLQMDTVSDLWTTTYGRVLLLKLAFVAIMMAIGAANRFFIVPSVERWGLQVSTTGVKHADPSRRFLGLLRLDTAIFVVIILCAALLGMQKPPGHEEHGHEHGMGDTAPVVSAAIDSRMTITAQSRGDGPAD